MTIQNIQLEEHTYSIDTDDQSTMSNALETEIKHQFDKRNIELDTKL